MQDALGRVQSLLVLGATSDIAQATARLLVADGTREVVLAARRPDALAEHARELEALGASSVRTVSFDAVAVADHPRVVEESFAQGDVDVALVAWGVLGDPARALSDHAHAAEILDVNLTGAVSVLVLLASRMRAQGHGTIVVLSSVAGQRVRRASPAYGASKAGLDGYALALGAELDGSGVRVVVVRPGFVRTKMTAGQAPKPAAVDAEAVADAIVDGIRTGRPVVWVPRSMRLAALALRALPWPVFRRLRM